MRKDLWAVLMVMAVSAGMAAASNIGWHKIDWIRAPRVGATSGPANGGVDPTTGEATGEQTQELTLDDIHTLLRDGSTRFVDAREPHEFSAGHLVGSILLPASAVYANIERVTTMVAPDERIIVYCTSRKCDASHVVSDVLRNEFSFTNVQVFPGGWEAIEAAGERFNDCVVTGENGS